MPAKHQSTGQHSASRGKKHGFKRKIALLAALVVISLATLGTSLAYILTNTAALENKFVPAHVSCQVEEDFSSGTEKKDVSVKNTGDASVYIRVKLLPYWYDKEDDAIIAKSAWAPSFTPGQGWVLGADGYYYYTSPVNPGASTSLLIPSLTLQQDDVSLARQVLEIAAECIQAQPDGAVTEAWSGENGSVTGVSGGKLTVAQGG